LTVVIAVLELPGNTEGNPSGSTTLKKPRSQSVVLLFYEENELAQVSE
jgi:hypothetical protein